MSSSADTQPEASARSGRGLGSRSYLILFAFTIPALTGYWVYGLHPERLAGSSLAMRFYPLSFQLFAQLQIFVAAVVLFHELWRRFGWTWLSAFIVICAASFTAEHLGTGYGVPFGGYAYTGLLGAKVGGRVPLLIPVSWFLMAVPSWVLAHRGFPERHRRGQRIVVGALWLVAWDLALDPAMSFLTPYWQWREAGPYYGMPWLNLAGWLTTGAVLMVILELFSSRIWWPQLGTRWTAGYYSAVLFMPVGMLIAAGEWLAVVATAWGVGALATATWASQARRTSGWSAPGPQRHAEA